MSTSTSTCSNTVVLYCDGFDWILKAVESYDDYELLPYFMDDYDKWKIWRAAYKNPTASLILFKNNEISRFHPTDVF